MTFCKTFFNRIVKCLITANYRSLDFPAGSDGKRICLQCRRSRFNPRVRKIPLEKGMATHSSILAWRLPWTEEPGGLQNMGLQRVRWLSD